MESFHVVGMLFHSLIITNQLYALDAAPSTLISSPQVIADQSKDAGGESLVRKNHRDYSMEDEDKNAIITNTQRSRISNKIPQIIGSTSLIQPSNLGKRTDGHFLAEGQFPGNSGSEHTVISRSEADPSIPRKRRYQGMNYYPLLHVLSGGKRYPVFRANRFPILHSVPASSFLLKRSGSSLKNFLQRLAAAGTQPWVKDGNIDYEDTLERLEGGDDGLSSDVNKRARRPKFPSSQNSDKDGKGKVIMNAGSSQLFGSKTGGFNSKKKLFKRDSGPALLDDGIQYIFTD